MSVQSAEVDDSAGTDAVVDPRAPRFGQSITATLLLAGAVLGRPEPVYLVAVVLGAVVLSGWRIDVYAVLWRHVAIPVVGPPDHRESAAPHRFAKLLGAVGAGVSSGLLLAGLSLPGFAVAAAVGLLAGLAATTGFCLGCRMYRQVSFLRERGVI